MSKLEAPVIRILGINELEIEPGYNVREAASFKANVKELRGLIASRPGLDPSQPITFVDKGGKKLIRRGHTVFTAAKEEGLKSVYALEVSLDKMQGIIDLVTSNAGHPLSQVEQGKVYVQMRDGTDPETAKKGEVIYPPMKLKEIADAVGYSISHVGNCIAITESGPEIAEMLMNGEVSANAVVLAKKGQTEKQATAILKKAITEAKKEDKIATEKHVRLFKETKTKESAKPAETSNGDSDATSGEKPLIDAPSSSNKPNNKPVATSAASLGAEGTSTETETLQPLPGTAPAANPETNKKKLEKAILETVVDWQCNPKVCVSLTEDQMQLLVDMLIDAHLPF